MATMGVPVTGVSELVLEVVDLEAAEAFYAGVLGLPVVDRWPQREAVWVMAGDRTLDSMVLTVGLDRETLVSNPMWICRIQQAVAAATPIKVEVRTELAKPDNGQPKEAVVDLRGHHLGVDRAQVG